MASWLRAGFGTAVALLALAYAGVMATKHYTPDSDPSLLTSGSGSAGASASASAGASNAVDYSGGPAVALAANELPTQATLATDAIATTHDNYEVVLTQHEFFDFPRVAEWLATKNVYRDSTQAELSQYLPDKIVVKGRRELIKGGLNYSNDVMEGNTLFSLMYNNQTQATFDASTNYSFEYDTFSSAFQIVIDMYGNIVSIAPTMYDLADGAWTGLDMHFIALKPYELDPSYMIGVADTGSTEYGPAYLWNWKGDRAKKYIQLTNHRRS
mmetsp:Transcript_99555/g.284604  ORF Transcript_99555/g.284604 Transcript_99555/m.284604 type:complete len:270 (-) Transcript_99555:983-1792(-)